MRLGKKTGSLLGPAFVFRTHDFNKLGSLSFNDKYFFGLLSFQERRASRISARLTGRHYLRYRWIANYRLNRKYDYVSRCIILEYMYVITREKLQILLLCKNGKNEVRIKLLTFQRTFNYFSSSKGITIINIFHSFSNRCNQIKFITEVRIRISIQSFHKIIIYLKKEK